MCEQFSPSLITTSLTRDNITQIIITCPLFWRSLLQNWHQTLMLLPWGGELLRSTYKDKNYIKCLWFYVFNSKPTLLSLIALRGVRNQFYVLWQRLPPINLPLIFHMKVMFLLAVWSLSVIEIAPHLGEKEHYSFMFLKAESGFGLDEVV